MNRVLTAAMTLTAVLLAATAQAQNVRLVHPLGSDQNNTCISTPCRTIGRAIEVAVPGDIIDIAAGEYTEVLTIDKSLTLRGAGQDNVTILQGGTGEPGTFILGRVITISGDNPQVSISDLVIRNGAPPFGVGVSQGGGLRVADSTLTMADVTVMDCSAGQGGGLYGTSSDITLSNVEFRGNNADSGGGLFNASGGAVELDNVLFAGNIAASGGGVTNLTVSGGTLSLSNSTFRDNQATTSDGVSNGGGIANLGPVGLTGMPLAGVSGDEGLTLLNVIFDNNSADNGGGMFVSNDGSTNLNNVTFRENSAASSGGGMHSENSAPSLFNVRFDSNSSINEGGGMSSIDSSPGLTNVVFRGNRTGGPPGCSPFCVLGNGGGMVSRDGSPRLTNVLFSGNLVLSGIGGGVNISRGDPMFINVTFSGNRAGISGGGMSISNDGDPALVPIIRNSIFWNNQDETGTGTASASIGIASQETFIAAFSMIQGRLPPGEGNLDGTDPGNDPMFLNTPDPENAPTLVGNPRLFPESPVIDVGNDAFVDGVDTDLDGNSRIIGPAVDLGPYEFTGEIDDVIFRDRFED